MAGRVVVNKQLCEDCKILKTDLDKVLLESAAICGNKKCINALIKEGTDVNKEDKYGYTPLIYATELGHENCVSSLIKLGANVNHVKSLQCRKGLTALISAASKGHNKCLSMLMKLGADMNSQDVMQCTKDLKLYQM